MWGSARLTALALSPWARLRSPVSFPVLRALAPRLWLRPMRGARLALCCRPVGLAAGEPEIHLLFETVDLRNLDRHAIAKPDDTAGSATHEVVSSRFEDEKIVLHG